MKNKRHIIIGSIFFIIHFLYNFFSGEWPHFDVDYYQEFFAYSLKVTIIVFIIILVLKLAKLLTVSKRYIYLYMYYAVIYYISAFLGNIIWMIIFNVQL